MASGFIGLYNGGSALGSSDVTATNWQNECCIRAAERWTASTGESVIRVGVYGSTSSGTATAEVGVYTFSGGVPVTLIGSANVTITTTAQVHWSSAVSWSLTNGTIYVVGLDWQTAASGSWTMRFTDPGSGTNTSISASQDALDNPWVQSSTGTGIGQFFAEVSGAADATATPGVVAVTAVLPDATPIVPAGPVMLRGVTRSPVRLG